MSQQSSINIQFYITASLFVDTDRYMSIMCHENARLPESVCPSPETTVSTPKKEKDLKNGYQVVHHVFQKLQQKNGHYKWAILYLFPIKDKQKQLTTLETCRHQVKQRDPPLLPRPFAALFRRPGLPTTSRTANRGAPGNVPKPQLLGRKKMRWPNFVAPKKNRNKMTF